MEDSILNEITLKPNDERKIITVIGVGGGGGNAVNYMWNMGIRNVNFLVCNTDQQILDTSPVKDKICIGNGTGVGGVPEKARIAAIEDIDAIGDYLKALNTHMLFITAGMGGGTGTGASPVIAKYAKEQGILTVAIVTSPLIFEGKERYDQAMEGIKQLRECVDSLLIIDNENIQNIYSDDPLATDAFGKANDILASAAKGISEIITTKSSYITVDFADVSKVMRDSGRAHMSVARASGKDRANIAVEQSLTSPLLGNHGITGAKDILLSISTSDSRPLRYNSEMIPILRYIQEHAHMKGSDGKLSTANIIWGMSVKPDLEDDIEIVLVATGFEEDEEDVDVAALIEARFTQNPHSPILRNARGAKREMREPMIDSITPIANGESVTLPEREPRYADIERLLRTPAYIAYKKVLKGDPTLPHKRGGSDDTQGGELF